MSGADPMTVDSSLDAPAPPIAGDAPVARGRSPVRALWRLEIWRLVRTHRLVALIGVYGFFGVTAAPMARYMADLLERFGGGVQVILPTAAPSDGFVDYASNVNQIGLVVFVMVASSALTVSTPPEMAVFLRTRVRRPWQLVLPRWVVNIAAGTGAFLLGGLVTWYGTVLLLGTVDAVGVVVGMVLECLYLAFIGAVVAAIGARLRSAVTVAAATIGIALLMAVVGSLEAIGRWLPSHLLGALSTLPAGADIGSFVPAALVTIALTAVLLLLAVRGAAAQEL